MMEFINTGAIIFWENTTLIMAGFLVFGLLMVPIAGILSLMYHIHFVEGWYCVKCDNKLTRDEKSFGACFCCIREARAKTKAKYQLKRAGSGTRYW